VQDGSKTVGCPAQELWDMAQKLRNLTDDALNRRLCVNNMSTQHDPMEPSYDRFCRSWGVRSYSFAALRPILVPTVLTIRKMIRMATAMITIRVISIERCMIPSFVKREGVSITDVTKP